MRYQQYSQFGYLNLDRVTVTLVNALADGSTNHDGVPVDTRVNLHGLNNTFSLYATDTISIGKSINLTFSGRYNRTTVNNVDGLPPGAPGSRGSLNGSYVFERFNPSAGITYAPWRFFSVYFSYSESSRAPSAIELGCADTNYPCNLPNALVSDPPLQQVVTRTLEAGLRGGGRENHLQWSAGWFRGENYHDLLFIASQQLGFGYFANFGRTQREGAEINISGNIRRLTIGGNYTFLSATYQSSQIIDGGSNSSNASALAGHPGLDDNITLQPGDQIPQIPRNMLKTYVDYQPMPKLTLNLDFVSIGRSFARGNENNAYQPDGVYYLGQGFSPGYGVLNAGAHYQLHPKMQLFVQLDNLLDHHYYTAAQLSATPYNNAGLFMGRPFPAVNGDYPLRNTTFFAPGAPIGAWGGIRIHF
jgi:outer membrane receptor protein involved in Fe transport